MSFYRKSYRPRRGGEEPEKCADPAKARARALDALSAREMTSTQLYERLCARFTEQSAAAAVAEMVSRYPNDSGIVYTLSRDGADKMCKALTGRRIRAVAYHAGMGAAERARAQKAFSDGDVQVVCATIAFGMGIDKSNIRWVIHNNLPGSIENYYLSLIHI